MSNLLDMFAKVVGDELFLRRWLSILTSPRLIELADDLISTEYDLDDAHGELWNEIHGMVKDLAQAAMLSLPDVPLDVTDAAVEMIFALVVTQRRSKWEADEKARQKPAETFKLVIQPLDGSAHDESHLEIVARASKNGLPVNEAWRAMAAELASCARPAFVWAPDNEVQIDAGGQSEDVAPDDGSDRAPAPLAAPIWACSSCVPLGPTRDETGVLCWLYLCGCANDGTILVIGADGGSRAVPCSMVRTAPSTSPAPQVEGLRRADAAGLTKAS